MSGLARKDYLGAGWYRREMTLPREWAGQRTWLNFGAVDWHARVWLNGRPIGGHTGGYTPFALDLSPYLQPGETAEAGGPSVRCGRRDDAPGQAGSSLVHPLERHLADGVAGGDRRGEAGVGADHPEPRR